LPPSLVVDVSVVVKWFAPEPGSAQASALRASHQLLAPDLLVAEFGNVLWKKVRMGLMTAGEARTAAADFVRAGPVSLHPTTPLLAPALDIATHYQRTVYDSLYLALALAAGCQLVTADQRLVNSLQGTPLAGSIVALTSI
jgi:predicted nucleic acid-binding protein